MLNSPIQFEGAMTNNKLTVMIIGLIVILLVIFLITSFISQSKDNRPIDPQKASQTSPSIEPSGSIGNNLDKLPTPISDDQVPTAPPTPALLPGKIVIDEIAVDNFRESLVRITTEGNEVLAENNAYQIVFDEKVQEFNIVIFGDNFETSRAEAEKIFLQKLAINEPNACRLFVNEIIPSSVNNKYAGQTLMLSFCTD